MATEAQILANRANSQLSAGPKTEAGKARASQNATKHGFYSKAFIVRDDEQEDFDNFLEELNYVLKPEGNVLLEGLFAQIIHAEWQLHRLRIQEAQIYANSLNPFDDDATIRKLELIARHRTRFERSRQSAMKQYETQATNFQNFTGIPYEWRREIPWVANVHSLHKSRRECTKAFTRESLLPPEHQPKQPPVQYPGAPLPAHQAVDMKLRATAAHSR